MKATLHGGPRDGEELEVEDQTVLKLGESISCSECGMTSYNPNDIRFRYCGLCRRWADGGLVGAYYKGANSQQGLPRPYFWHMAEEMGW